MREASSTWRSRTAERYETAEYQWLVDWFFLQRTEPECRQLFAASGYDMDQLEMSRDKTGVILDYVGRSPRKDAPCRRSDGESAAVTADRHHLRIPWKNRPSNTW